VKGLILRDARPADRQAVLGFCRSTWPAYGDYIPRVWKRWIADTGGRFIVAELEGRPVGIGKVTQASPGEIWLEGLRVDPAYRGLGIARAVNLEVLRTIAHMQPRAVRFCTGATNRASRRMGEEYGFRVVARLRYYWQKARKARVRGDLAGKRDIGDVYDFIQRSGFLRLTSGLIAEGWVFREFSRGLLGGYIKEKRVVVIPGAGGIAGVGIYPFEENDRALTLGFADGDDAAIGMLARNCMYLARARNMSNCSVAVPTRGYARKVEEAGCRRKDSTGQVVYELGGRDLERLSATQAE
jgi:ribosomal protein S18 acetylase RimI-like enzyme